jgi:hypothetical protein
MAYQVARRMKAIKRDCELAIFGASTAKVAGSDTVARKMGSLDSYLSSTSYQGGVGAVAPTGNGATAPTPGTPRALTEPLWKGALQQLWVQSGGNSNIIALCGAAQRTIISGFTGSATRYVSTEDKKLVASIDVYDGDYHTVTVQPDRYTQATNVFFIDSEYLALSDLRPIFTKDLAVIGDSTRKEIIWETTLEVCNPLAHMNLADLT